MPPKAKLTKEDIVQASLALIRESGAQACNARAIASRLGCSTQPIFSNFESMEQLEQNAIEAAYRMYLGFIDREVASGKYPRYKAFGMAYIRFAFEERELFRLLFMRDRRGEGLLPSPDFEESVQMITNVNGISEQTARLMHTELWICVHGIGTMLATSFLSFEWEDISNMITDVYQGLRTRHTKKEAEL